MIMLSLLALGSAASAPMRWSSIGTTIDDSTILEPMDVEAHPGRLLGVLGPSGAGKTTLLTVLSGRVPAHPRRKLSRTVATSAHDVVNLEQSETFLSLLTV